MLSSFEKFKTTLGAGERAHQESACREHEIQNAWLGGWVNRWMTDRQKTMCNSTTLSSQPCESPELGD